MEIKIRQTEVNKFRWIRNGETDTTDEEIRYKITRNFKLGKVVTVLSDTSYVVKFGTFCMLYNNGEIMLIYRDFNKPVRVNPYDKYKYDYQHRGKEYANAKSY